MNNFTSNASQPSTTSLSLHPDFQNMLDNFDFDPDFDFDFDSLDLDINIDFDDPLCINLLNSDSGSGASQTLNENTADFQSKNISASSASEAFNKNTADFQNKDMASDNGSDGLHSSISPSTMELCLPLPGGSSAEDASCSPMVNDSTKATVTNPYSLTFQQPTTHAERNPLLPTQDVRPRAAKRTLDPVQARTMNEAKIEKQRQAQLVRSDLMQLMAAFEANVADLAKRHSVKVEYVKELMSVATKLKRQRGIGRMQALIYLKAKEVNSALPIGMKSKAPALRRLVKDDEQLHNLSDEKVEEAKREIEQKRLLSTRGLRPNCISGGKDFAYTTELMKKEFDNLHIRTGALGFGFVIPADRHERGIPSWFSAGQDVAEFIRKELNTTMWDLMGQFELWGNSKGSARPSTHIELQTNCSTIIAAALHYVLKNKTTAMNYTNYHNSIINKYHIQLIGLPDFETFKDGYGPIPVNPFSIKKRPELEALHAALESGACRWVRMSSEEIKGHADWLATQEVRERRERSDKGTKRGRRKRATNADDGDECDHENAPPPKRQKTSREGGSRGGRARVRGRVTQQLPRQVCSREVLTDTDDDDDGYNSGDMDI